MARTPLLNTLRCLFRDARTARANSLSLAALHELRAAHADGDKARGISRRTFLASAGAATAATLIPRLSFAAADPTIVIVGAGIAGLNCALELADLGISSTVYEASGRIGGRMFSNTGYWSANQITEWGGELIDSGHRRSGGWRNASTCRWTTCLPPNPAGPTTSTTSSAVTISKRQADRDFLAVSDRSPPTPRRPAFPRRLIRTRHPDERSIG